MRCPASSAISSMNDSVRLIFIDRSLPLRFLFVWQNDGSV
jgi:hypothetical protein